MRIDLPCCRHSEMKRFCKYHSDGNCILNISECKAPCEKYIDEIVKQLEEKSRFLDDVNEHGVNCIACVIGQKESIEIVEKGGMNE